MIKFKFSGKVAEVSAAKEGVSKNGKGWRLIDFVCTVPDGRYEDNISLTAKGLIADNVEALDMGDNVDIEGCIYAINYNNKWYNRIEALSIRRSD
jgi:hypothetical protein